MRSLSLEDLLDEKPTTATSFMDRQPEIGSQPSAPQALSVQNPQVDVKDYLMKKNGIGKYSDENRQKIVDENAKYDFSGNAMAALSALGAGFQGRDAGAAGNAVLQRNKQEKLAKLDEFDTGRKQMLENQNTDPTSSRSMAFKKAIESNFPDIAKAYGPAWNDVSAADQNLIFEPLKLKETIDARKMMAQEQRDERRFLAGMKQQDRRDAQAEKQEEKLLQLGTPYGTAITADDAKNLKSAHEAKMNFDNKLQEMINLRKKHGGGAMLNFEDVARGKQLSKDLLLEYKNMAKLGVLSKSDEDIINAIIPEDPLEYNSPLAAIQGQDPTLHRLEKFKGDSDKDFSNRVQTRIRGGKPSLVGDSAISQKDQQALEWAKSNPDDPRAAQILKRLGM